MRWVKVMLSVVLGLAVPAVALAHGGIADEGKHHETVQAGPYTVVVDFADWPLRALKSNRLIVQPVDGIAGKSATLRLVPASPAVYPRTITRTLHPYPGVDNAWALQFGGLPAQGPWTFEIEVDGPQGKGVARLGPVEVVEPPGVPLWLGWAIGLTPLYGLVWFGIREARRVRAPESLAE